MAFSNLDKKFLAQKMNADNNPPPVSEQIKNAGRAARDFTKSGFKFATDEEYERRMAICRPCKFWKNIKGPLIGRCMKCGCSGLKQKLAVSSCPIKLW